MSARKKQYDISVPSAVADLVRNISHKHGVTVPEAAGRLVDIGFVVDALYPNLITVVDRRDDNVMAELSPEARVRSRLDRTAALICGAHKVTNGSATFERSRDQKLARLSNLPWVQLELDFAS